jgi:histidine ammonia-lyase
MTGIGLVNIYRAQKLVKWCMLLSATINEIFEAFDDHIHDKLNSTKLHNGQNKIAFAMRAVLQGSRLLKNRKEYMYYDTDETHFKYKVQEYYSLRCVPQILGPVYDTVQYAENVLVNELNSVSDNPVVDEESENVFHGGNFHGDYISLEMDKVRIAITKLSMLAERQLNYLLNDKLNGSLPPFINRSVIGLNFGLQGVQYTATSTVAENQSLSGSVYIHSIPNNKDNQDVVSMGSNAALLTARVIENSFEVLAIEAIAVAEAIESLGNSDKLNQSSLKFYNDLRRILPPSADDQPVFRHIKSVKQYLENNDLTEIDTQL